MAKNFEPENKLPNMIGAGTKITGNIETNGDIKIDGNIEGNISSKGKVVVGPTGLVNGEIFCGNAIISGTLKGKVTVSELLSLKATSKLNGDIITSKLTIEPGALFSGTCKMGNDLAKNSVSPKEEKK